MPHKLRLGTNSFSDGDNGEPFSRIESVAALHSTISSARCSVCYDTTNAVKKLFDY
jgi:hypothetical protein